MGLYLSFNLIINISTIFLSENWPNFQLHVYSSEKYSLSLRKHVRVMYTPLNPTFIKQNWGMKGNTYFFFIFAPKYSLWVLGYSLEPPR